MRAAVGRVKAAVGRLKAAVGRRSSAVRRALSSQTAGHRQAAPQFFGALVLGLPLAVAGADIPAVLLLCVALTLGALFYTFYLPDQLAEAPEKSRLAFLRERKETVYENLRDLNFEYKAGKFPESDYRQMRNSLEEEAAALLAEIQDLEGKSMG
jgi:hypothetical protein